ncbi:MAG TPA: YfiR family protein [Polyangia bacterium]
MAAQLVVAFLAAPAAATPTSGPADVEPQIKAEFLERFTHFIDWPQGGDAGPFVIAVVGPNPFGGALDRLARDRTIKGRRVVVRYLAGPAEVGGQHVLFITRELRGALKEILARTRDRPVLTVGDTDGFARAGVLINFYLERGAVRFEINAGEAKRSGLRVSPKLLRLGRIVTTEDRR